MQSPVLKNSAEDGFILKGINCPVIRAYKQKTKILVRRLSRVVKLELSWRILVERFFEATGYTCNSLVLVKAR
jgi:hypothetical protein